MSSVLASFLHLRQLDATNWYEWKTHVSSLMILSGLLGYIDSTIPRPQIPQPSSQTPTAAEAKAIEDATKAQSDWEAKDREAHALLLISISGSELDHTKGAKTAAEIWLQLGTIKEPKSARAILVAWQRLFRLIMEDGTWMEEHIATFRHAQDELANMGHALSDKDFSLLLIMSLPEAWDQFTSGLFGSIASLSLKVTLNELISVLMEEDRRCREWTGSSEVANLNIGPPRGM